MSTSTLAYEVRRARGLARAWDYIELTKPKISALVLLTVAVGAFIGAWSLPDVARLLHTLLGTALVAASASAWNQWLEKDRDALMPRTAARPLPSGRLTAGEVLTFGTATLILGLVWLVAWVNVTAAALGLLTWISYVCVYTPLKTQTVHNTAVGAVGGALPAMIGWAAVDGQFGLAAATLFLVIYLWQFPHFMAIAWLYRDQYEAAGMKMLPSADSTAKAAARQALAAALVLVPVSLVPIVAQAAGSVYLAAALALGACYVAASARFFARRQETTARGLLRVSLFYLPAQLALMMMVPLI